MERSTQKKSPAAPRSAPPRASAAAAAPAARRPKAAAAQVEGEGEVGGSSGRTLRLLRTIASAGRPVSLADLASDLRLPKATAHRLCAQLLEGGYLARDLDERHFVVGPTLRRLALDTLNNDSVRGLRHEVLRSLVAQVGETCNFTTLDGANVLYLDRVEAPWAWRLTLDVGAHVPLHCTASGKLFLALMPAAQREAVFAQLPLQRITATTLTTPQELRAECEEIERNGYSVDREEFIPGLVAVAVPVLDGEGRARAAVAVHAPAVRMSLEVALTKLPLLRDAAARLRGLL